MLKKKQFAVAAASVMLTLASAGAYAATIGPGNTGVTTGQPTGQPTAAQTRKSEKQNSDACKQKTEENNREKQDDADREDRDSETGSLSHDSHAGSHKQDTRHDDLVHADHDREAMHEQDRKLACGEIDDGKSMEGEHDDRDRKNQHDNQNNNAENNQRR